MYKHNTNMLYIWVGLTSFANDLQHLYLNYFLFDNYKPNSLWPIYGNKDVAIFRGMSAKMRGKH